MGLPGTNSPWSRAILLSMVFGLPAPLLAVALWTEPPMRPALPCPLLIGGRALPAAPAHDLAVRDFARDYLAGEVRISAGPHTLTLSRAELGAVVDGDHLAALWRDLHDRRSAIRRVHAQRQGHAPLNVGMPISLDERALLRPILQLQDAYLGHSEGGRVPPRASLDLPRSLDRLAEALRRGEEAVTLLALPTPSTRAQ